MSDTLNELYKIICARRTADKNISYVAKIFAKGRKKIAQKVGEEAVETVVAALAEGKQELIEESSDLLFHLLILWADCGVTPQEIILELERRREKGKNPDKPQQM